MKYIAEQTMFLFYYTNCMSMQWCDISKFVLICLIKSYSQLKHCRIIGRLLFWWAELCWKEVALDSAWCGRDAWYSWNCSASFLTCNVRTHAFYEEQSTIKISLPEAEWLTRTFTCRCILFRQCESVQWGTHNCQSARQHGVILFIRCMIGKHESFKTLHSISQYSLSI